MIDVEQLRMHLESMPWSVIKQTDIPSTNTKQWHLSKIVDKNGIPIACNITHKDAEFIVKVMNAYHYMLCAPMTLER